MLISFNKSGIWLMQPKAAISLNARLLLSYFSSGRKVRKDELGPKALATYVIRYEVSFKDTDHVMNKEITRSDCEEASRSAAPTRRINNTITLRENTKDDAQESYAVARFPLSIERVRKTTKRYERRPAY